MVNTIDYIAKLSLEKRKLLLEKLRKQKLISEAGNQQKKFPILTVPREGNLQLSFAQERLWFLDQLVPDNPFYNIPPMALILRGWLTISALRQALGEIVRRHESLRTRFEFIDDKPVQIIEQDVPFLPNLLDLSNLSSLDREKETQRILSKESLLPFNLKKDLMLRARLLLLDAEEHVLLLTMHHIASDVWSMGILQKELSELYNAFSKGEQSPLPELTIQYVDFAVWQRKWLSGEVLDSQLSYWKDHLSNITPLEIPTDYMRPAIQTFRGDSLPFYIEPDVTKKLKTLSQEKEASLYMTLLAAFSILLSRYSGQEDIAIGSPIANRNRKEIENLIGFFINTLVMRTDLSGNPTFLKLMNRTKKMTLDAYANQDLPFEYIVEELQPERSMSQNPLIQIYFAIQNTPVSTLKMQDLEVSRIEAGVQMVKNDMEVHVWEKKDGLEGVFIYDSVLFKSSTITRMIGHFINLLTKIVSSPEIRISEISVLSEDETHKILVEWNDTKAEYPNDKCIHELFEEQVGKTPDAVAVVFEDEQISYRELNLRANQLAHFLIKVGVNPGDCVGLILMRSIELVISEIAVLKCGGIYVPIDPEHPVERSSFMFSDCSARLIIGRISDPELNIPWLDIDNKKWLSRKSYNSAIYLGGESSAYVMYTSG
ncbi:MAG: condensation domain-containing protein, partial [Desulfobacteraceae bacterium]